MFSVLVWAGNVEKGKKIVLACWVPDRNWKLKEMKRFYSRAIRLTQVCVEILLVTVNKN